MTTDCIRALITVCFCTALVAACGADTSPKANSTPLQAVSATDPTYVGSSECAGCHAQAWQQWQQSHHQRAMSEADSSTVLGDFAQVELVHGSQKSVFQTQGERFVITTADAVGELSDVTVRYTFGVEPLQQYLVDIGGGRLQALPMVWDSRSKPVRERSVPHKGGWYHLNPNITSGADPEHWSRGGQNWNHMCADCHSTAVRKNYRPVDDSFATEFAEISVGCEACHGPGSLHAKQPNNVSLPALNTADQQLNACARCHSRRGQLAEGFKPEHNYLDYYLPSLLDEGLYHADGQILDEVFVYGSFVQSKMHAAGVACSNCHEAHSAELKIEGNGLCTQCHNPTGRAEFPSLVGAVYDSSEHHFHPVDSQGAECVSCHMPEQVYMGIDGRRDHSFRIPRPDLTASTGAPNACTSCHEAESAQWAADAVAEHFGAPTVAKTEHFGVVFAQARDGQLKAEQGLVSVAADADQADIVRATALALMAGYQRQSSADALVQGLRSESALQRIGALRGAARWSFAERWRLSRRLLQDPLLAVRNEAVLALLEGLNQLPAAQQGQLQEAVEEYISIQQLHLDRPSARTNLANVRLQMGQFDAAQKQLQQALTLNPDWVPGLVNLADIYRATGRDELAGKLLNQALERVPDSAEVLVAKALWLVRQGRRQAGVELLQRAYQNQPGQQVAYLYAAALHSTGNSDQALKVVDAVIESGRRFEQMLNLGIGIAQEVGDAGRQSRYRGGVAPPL